MLLTLLLESFVQPGTYFVSKQYSIQASQHTWEVKNKTKQKPTAVQ